MMMFYLHFAVSPLASLRKTTDWIFAKILPEMYLWTRKNSLKLN